MTRPPLRRTVRLGMRGLDVEAHTAAMHRYLRDGQLKVYREQRPAARQTFGVGKRTLAKKAAAKAGLPAYGVVGPALYDAMWKAKAYDEKCKQLLEQDAEAQKPRLVEPNQGWGSLHPSLWPAYSLGRSRFGLSDLGTYNPASRLPSGLPSDHAVYPAMAFDLGFSPATGWANVKARAYARLIVGRKEIEYVIVGDRIYTGWWKPYRSGGHESHVHVSGVR